MEKIILSGKIEEKISFCFEEIIGKLVDKTNGEGVLLGSGYHYRRNQSYPE